MQMSRLRQGDPTVANGAELDIIAAVVIGGGSLSGGEGSIAGSIIGALIMAFLRNGCQQMGWPNYIQEIIIGVIIVLAVALDRARATWAERSCCGRARVGILSMAGLRVIDAHVHFWDPSVLRYPWLAGEPALATPFRPSDFAPLTSGEIDAVVFVEANPASDQAADEVAWVDSLADSRILASRASWRSSTCWTSRDATRRSRDSVGRRVWSACATTSSTSPRVRAAAGVRATACSAVGASGGHSTCASPRTSSTR
jgi:hypothetical protein